MLRQVLRGGNEVLSGNERGREPMCATSSAREVLRRMSYAWVAVEINWGSLGHYGASDEEGRRRKDEG